VRHVAFAALACDYDGTLAIHDRIPAVTVAALVRARERGIRLVLVTGRTLFELTRVCASLELFDAVVAENGGVLYFPRDRAVREEGPPPPPRLLEELDRRSVPYTAGHVLVATLHRFRDAVLDAIRAAEVTVNVVANRAALMLLPPLISKGTGVATALLALGVPARDVLAIGDAENDLPMFDVCGWSACPDDALAEVVRRVDWILPGAAGEGVGSVIAERIVSGMLPPPRHGSQFVHLGWVATTSDPIEFDPRGSNLLVHGDSLCGKSTLVGGLVERVAGADHAVCVLDPEGDYRVLAQAPQAHVIAVAQDADWDTVLERLAWRTPVVADLGGVPHAAQVALGAAGLVRLRRSRDRRDLPYWLVVDEAQYLLHAGGVPPADAGLDAKGVCLVTYRSSWLSPAVVAAMDVFVLGATTDTAETAFLEAVLSPRGLDGRAVTAAARELPTGSFVIARPGMPITTFVPPPRAIRHIRHLAKYVDHGVATHHRFLFRAPGGGVVASAGTLHEFVQCLATVPTATIGHHARHGDFSRWIREVFQEELLAGRVAKVERRWCRGELRNLVDDVDALMRRAYATPPGI
jgi:hydroxymethylpyrimidine pyrophosphatase-like HAD family hydrolase